MDEAEVLAFWKHHKQVWDSSNATELTSGGGMDFLELTTTGRKSGEPRSVLLSTITGDNEWIVIASNIGRPNHPNWWQNLQASDYLGTVRIAGGETFAVKAVELEGDERSETWERVKEIQPLYVDYEAKTEGIRRIPIVSLRPVG